VRKIGAVVIAVGLFYGANASVASDLVTVMSVERAAFAKAPFKRQFQTLEVADVAAADVVSDANLEVVTVTQVATGANRKAPFRRRQVEIAVTDIAAMELGSVDSPKRYEPSRKPPYNRHR